MSTVDVAALSAMKPMQLVDGVWSEPDDESSPTAVDAALVAAWRDHRRSNSVPSNGGPRAAALRHTADQLDSMCEEIATLDSLSSGVPITITRLFAGSLGATLRSAADRIPSLASAEVGIDGRTVRLHRLPLGPAIVLAPWNAPSAVAGKKAGFAWAAGCPVIIKPSPWSPSSTMLLAQAFQRGAAQAGLPRASIQLVLGGVEVGQRLVRSPYARAVAFTGSRVGGRAVAAAASEHLAATQLELGSNNPAIVLEDADIALTASALAAGMTKLNGAWCESPGTVFVPAAIRDELVKALVRELEQLCCGEPMETTTTFGPQAFDAQAEQLRERIIRFARGGATVLSVGTMPPGIRWVPPTLIIDPADSTGGEEVFGPVLVIRTCDEVQRAIDAAFELDTGLAGYVFTRDLDAGLGVGAQLPEGEVKINGSSLLDMSPRSTQTFWYGSGVGAHGDAELLEFFTGSRIVGQDVDSAI